MTDLSGTEILSWKTGTAAAWTAANPTLTVSEPGVESDTRKWKLGDGATAWIDLPYETGSTWADMMAAPDFPDSIAAGDTPAEARAAIAALGSWADVIATTDFPDAAAVGDTPAEARAAIEALGADDIPATVSPFTPDNSDVTGADANDVWLNVGDGSYRFGPSPEPVNFIAAITKEEGDSTPGGTAPKTFVMTLAGAGSAWGYDTDLASPGGARSTSGTTVTLTLTQPVAVNRYVIVAVGAEAAAGIESSWSATDSKGHTYTQDLRNIQGNTNQVAFLQVKVTTALVVGDTITITSDVTRTQVSAKALSVVGAAASSALDKTALGGNAGSASLLIGPSAITTQVDEIAIAAFVFQGSGITFTPTNGWIMAGPPMDSSATTSRRTLVVLYKILTATGLISATGNTALTAGGAPQSVNYTGALITIKKA